MARSEAETRTQLIDPALHARGWTEDLIRREETLGTVEIVDGQPRRQTHGRTDYTLRIKVAPDAQPVAVAVLEAKSEDKPATYGLDQAKAYQRTAKRLNVPFVIATNGHQWTLHDNRSGDHDTPAPPDGRVPDPRGPPGRVRGRRRHRPRPPRRQAPHHALQGRRDRRAATTRTPPSAPSSRSSLAARRAPCLSLATGSGKTFIAVNLLRRIADAGQLKPRPLPLRPRGASQPGPDRVPERVRRRRGRGLRLTTPRRTPASSIATYQTLDIDTDDADADFLEANYPPDYFSHIVIDECHRSAWGKWSEVLTRNPNAVQIGLTATPRQLDYGKTAETAGRRRHHRRQPPPLRRAGLRVRHRPGHRGRLPRRLRDRPARHLPRGQPVRRARDRPRPGRPVEHDRRGRRSPASS